MSISAGIESGVRLGQGSNIKIMYSNKKHSLPGKVLRSCIPVLNFYRLMENRGYRKIVRLSQYHG